MVHSGKRQSNSVRIIGGEFRSRKLDFPDANGLRPTGDRIRETLFNWLQDSIQGEDCLDLFAGSGALGFEALSRGAKRVDFIEKDRAAAAALENNIKRLDANQGNVFCADALQWIDGRTHQASKYGLVFLDPPFAGPLLAAAIAKLEDAEIMRPDCLVYVENDTHSEGVVIPSHWQEMKKKRAGAVNYSLLKVSRIEG